MQNEVTYEAAIIEANRAKCMDILIEAARFRISKKPEIENRYYGVGRCPTCRAVFRDRTTNFCGNCGQAIDWT